MTSCPFRLVEDMIPEPLIVNAFLFSTSLLNPFPTALQDV
jgi:hypothetical protein